jgi:hypothetical protein
LEHETYRKLTHLQDEQIAPQLLEQAPHDKLVDARGEEERDEGCRVLVDFHGRNGAVVDVPEEKHMYRPIPLSSKLIP